MRNENRIRLGETGALSSRAGWLGILAGVVGTGCASSTLPVKHVVLYRNGVGYFERVGHVSREQVRFNVRPIAVNDLLATLAVSEHAAGSAAPSPVRAVHLDARSGGEAAETVVLSLDGKSHDLTVGYIASSPVWKPSYRLVLHPGGQASLQIWGIVENDSGEDWKGVRLSLVAGAPIAYASDLSNPVVPQRPRYTDQGQEAPAIPEGAGEYGYARGDIRAQRMMIQGTASARTSAESPATSTSSVDQPAAARRRQLGLMTRSADTNLRAAVARAFPGASTRYDLSADVSIPNESASMVMVVDRPVTGELAFLFSPLDAVPDSDSHPFHAVRFVNGTGGALEGGPLAMLEDDAFLGQAIIEPLEPGASALVPFAVERAIEVTREARSDDLSGPLTAGAGGAPTMHREHSTRTIYRVRNDSDQAANVVIRHTRAPETRLDSPPKGTEENASGKAALAPLTVPAHGNAELSFDERAEISTAVDWLAPSAELAVRRYLSDPKSDPRAVEKLTAAWAIRGEIVKLGAERSSLRMKLYDLEQSGARGTDPALKASYQRQIKELDGKVAELTAKFEKALGEIAIP